MTAEECSVMMLCIIAQRVAHRIKEKSYLLSFEQDRERSPKDLRRKWKHAHPLGFPHLAFVLLSQGAPYPLCLHTSSIAQLWTWHHPGKLASLWF